MTEIDAYHEMYPNGPQWPDSNELAEFGRRWNRAFGMTYDERELLQRTQSELDAVTMAYDDLKHSIRSDWLDMLESEHYDELLVAMEMV